MRIACVACQSSQPMSPAQPHDGNASCGKQDALLCVEQRTVAEGDFVEE